MTYSKRRALAAELVAAGRRLDGLGLVPARDGNLSARFGPDRILVTPTGVRKRELTADRMVETDLHGRPQSGGRASTEIGMHLAVYRARPDVHAVVHAHPPIAVGFACAGLGLTDCLMPEVVVHLGSVPLTPYATPGTPELEASIATTVEHHDALLLANHGAVTMGTTVGEALDRMETLEHFARIALVAKLLGGPRPLTSGELVPLENIRRKAGNLRPATCEPAVNTPPPGQGDALPAGLAGLVAEAVRSALGPDSTPPRKS